MTVVPKPQHTTMSPAEREKLINKGGSGPDEGKPKDKKKHYPLSLPQSLYDKIISLIERRSYKIPVNAWLLEAIAEKIKREENADLL